MEKFNAQNASKGVREDDREGVAAGEAQGEDENQEIYANKNEDNRVTEDISIKATPILILCFVSAMCLFLLLLYFFFDQLGMKFLLIKVLNGTHTT